VDTGEAVKKQSHFGGLTKLDAEAGKTWDDHGRDGRGTGTPNAIDRVWEPTHGRDAHATHGQDARATDRTSAPNKPNLGHRRARSKRLVEKELW
jgi:hypothetical protein